MYISSPKMQVQVYKGLLTVYMSVYTVVRKYLKKSVVILYHMRMIPYRMRYRFRFVLAPLPWHVPEGNPV